jgi:hypothetical protein
VIAKRRQGGNGRQVVGFRLWDSLTSQGSAWFNPRIAFFKYNPRRLDHPISGIWPNATQAVSAAISPIKLPILLDAGAGTAEHFPAVGPDVGGALANAGRVVPPDAARFAHDLHPGGDSMRLTTGLCNQRANNGWVLVTELQQSPDQPVQLIV